MRFKNTDTNGTRNDDSGMGCTFKRGGMCNVHGRMGKKNVLTRKVWSKAKDGTFKWVTKKQTTYACRDDTTTVPDLNESRNLVSGMPDRALGVGTDNVLQGQTVHLYSDSDENWFCGLGQPGAGAT